jgi:hypothetical protein
MVNVSNFYCPCNPVGRRNTCLSFGGGMVEYSSPEVAIAPLAAILQKRTAIWKKTCS